MLIDEAVCQLLACRAVIVIHLKRFLSESYKLIEPLNLVAYALPHFKLEVVGML